MRIKFLKKKSILFDWLSDFILPLHPFLKRYNKESALCIFHY